jgi:hypothetical protein
MTDSSFSPFILAEERRAPAGLRSTLRHTPASALGLVGTSADPAGLAEVIEAALFDGRKRAGLTLERTP